MYWIVREESMGGDGVGHLAEIVVDGKRQTQCSDTEAVGLPWQGRMVIALVEA